MRAVYAAAQSVTDPLSGLVVGERPEPVARPGWTTVALRAAGLNHHDIWSLKGVGLPADRLPEWARAALAEMVPAVYDEALAAERGQEWMSLWDRTIRGKGAAAGEAR